MAKREIEIDVKVNDKQAEQGLSKINTNVLKVGASFKKLGTLTSSALGSIVSLKGAIAAAGAAFAVSKVVAAANEQEDAINALNTSLKITGKFSEEASQSFQEYASSLQEVTKFGDEAILRNAALIQQLGNLSDKELRKATKATLDLAAGLGIDLNSAANLVGKAAAGFTGTLGRYGITVKKAATDSETFARALDEIEKKFGGAAQAQVKTFSGALQQAQNTFGDLLEEIGFLITRNPVVIKAVGALSKGFSQLIGVIKQNSGVLKDITTNVFSALISTAGATARAVLEIGVAFVKITKSINDFINRGQIQKLISEREELQRRIIEEPDIEREAAQKRVAALDIAINATKEANQTEIEDYEAKITAIESLQQSLLQSANNINTSIVEANATKNETLALQEQERTQKAIDELTEREELLTAVRDEFKAIRDEKAQIEKDLETAEGARRIALLGRRLKLEKKLEKQSNLEKLTANKKFEKAREDLRKTADQNEIANYEARLKLQQSFTTASLNLANNLAALSIAISGKQNKAIFLIQKAAAVAQAVVATSLGVTKALGAAPPPANFALASLVGAAGAAQIATITATAIQGFAKGGLVEGGVPGRDSVPMIAQRGEIVAPRSNFEEVIGSVRAQREAEALREEGGAATEVTIGFADNAFEIIETKLIERQRLGISTL